MERQEIVRNNELIAEFIGMCYTEDIIKKWNVDRNKASLRCINFINGIIGNTGYLINLEFHSNWNWLMLAVDKIEYIGYGVTIYQYKTNIYNGVDHMVICNEVGDDKFEGCYKTVIAFIKNLSKNLDKNQIMKNLKVQTIRDCDCGGDPNCDKCDFGVIHEWTPIEKIKEIIDKL